MRAGTLIILCGLVTLAPGCFWFTTKSEGKSIRKDVSQIEATVSSQEQKIDAKMIELQKLIKEATKLLARNSADLGQDVRSLDSDLRKLRGLLNEVKRYTDELREDLADLEARMDERDNVYQMKLADLDKRLMELEAKAAGPQTPGALWKEGKRAFDRGEMNTARNHFKRLAIRFPDDEHADDAQFFRAETYMNDKSWEQAIIEYQKIFDKYSKSQWADNAFWRAGQAAEQLKSCREARAYYGALRSKFKRSKLARKAAKRDAFLKKHAKNRKYCRK